MPERKQRQTLDDLSKTQVLQRLIPKLADQQSTLIVYNTVARLLNGDLQHTVSIKDIGNDLYLFPSDWVVVGIGTTSWLKRNGEMMPDGTARNLHFWWADPKTAPQSHVIDLANPKQAHGDNIADLEGTVTIKTDAKFPFLALAVCKPDNVKRYQVSDIDNLHTWLQQKLADEGIRVAGIQVKGMCEYVKSTDAHYIPEDGLDLSGGYVGDKYFLTSEHGEGEWTINGIYSNDQTILPFISVPSAPIHLHGYQQSHVVGGHVVEARVKSAEVSLYPLADVMLKIHNV